MENKDLKKLAYDWSVANKDIARALIPREYYCESRDIFEARNDKMLDYLISNKIDDGVAYMAHAISGEVGNNAFDHNIGKWPDILGVFFTYNYSNKKCVIMIADRGVGILKTLQKAIPSLSGHDEALSVAMTKRISGRVLENRGNGLKFVKSSVEDLCLFFEIQSGDYIAVVNGSFEIKKSNVNVPGCVACLEI